METIINNTSSFLNCPACAGQGHIDNKKCASCNSQGMGLWFGNTFLYWGKRINALQIAQDKIKSLIRVVINIILFIIGVLGFLALGWFMLKRDWYTGQDLKFWLIKDFRVLIFWFTLIADMYLYYRLDQHKLSEIKVKRENYDPEMGLIARISRWEQLRELDSKLKIDVSLAYSLESIKVIERSWETASQFHHREVKPIHLLVGLIETKKVNIIFSRLGIDAKLFVEKITRTLSKDTPFEVPKIIISKDLKKILLNAYEQAYVAHENRVEATALLLALTQEEGVIMEILYDLEIDRDKIKNVVEWLRIQERLRRNWQRFKGRAKLKPKGVMNRAMTAVATPVLNRFSQDITILAKYGYLTPCVGRGKEIEAIFRVIEGGRKSTILVGPPGVGKMSIIEGIAQKMVTEEVPKILQDKRLVSLSIPKLVSGATPADAEGRLLTILNEVTRAGNIVLIVNDIQDMIGITAGTEESLDLSEVLVGPITRGEILVIATATRHDYTNYIESTAIGGAFTKTNIEEPEINQAIQILEAKSGGIEYRNKVYFSYGAIEAAAKLSERYIHDRFQPEKSIQIIEEVAVYVRKKKGEKATITAEDVAYIISEKTKIPVTKVTEKESEKLLGLENQIHKRIINQEEAVKTVAKSLRRARAELREIKRPIVNLLFLGPTGVGKTELAKVVAHVYFGAEERMIRLDMSEYQEKSSINRLIGAPEGYGRGGGAGYLTEAVRKNPFSLLLLDEIEKAHPDILNIFLQVMDDGRLTDSQGRTVDFTNVILIGTSNAGTSFIQDEVKKNTPVEKIKELLIERELKPYYRPEFLNRFDGIIVFKPLSMQNVQDITRLFLNKVAKRLEDHGVTLEVSDEAVKELAEAGFDPIFGARPLKRVIQEKVDDVLANYILEKKLGRRDKIVLGPGGEVRIEKAVQI